MDQKGISGTEPSSVILMWPTDLQVRLTRSVVKFPKMTLSCSGRRVPGSIVTHAVIALSHFLQSSQLSLLPYAACVDDKIFEMLMFESYHDNSKSAISGTEVGWTTFYHHATICKKCFYINECWNVLKLSIIISYICNWGQNVGIGWRDILCLEHFYAWSNRRFCGVFLYIMLI